MTCATVVCDWPTVLNAVKYWQLSIVMSSEAQNSSTCCCLCLFILFNAVMSSDIASDAEREYIPGHPAELYYCFWISGIRMHQCRVSSLYAGWRGPDYLSES